MSCTCKPSDKYFQDDMLPFMKIDGLCPEKESILEIAKLHSEIAKMSTI